MKKYQIALIGLLNGMGNLGDVVIYECTRYLVENILKELEINNYNLIPIDMEQYCFSDLPKADLFLFVGGGLIKFKYQKLYQYINQITSFAQEHTIPVVFLGVGVEGYDNTRIECNILENSLKRTCVKQITTRDNLKILTDFYQISNQIAEAKIADSAIFASEVYNIQKKPSNLIGLGMIREGIFRSNGIDIGFEELTSFWLSVITELEQLGIEWRIFTNGYSSDMKFVQNFLLTIGRIAELESKVILQNGTAQSLVETISNFNGVIAGRLHANIISYSLDIPSVGIVWNEKLTAWGNTIGYPERFLKYQDLDGQLAVHTLLQAMNEGYHKIDYKQFQNTTKNFLRKILSMYYKNIK